MTARSTAEAQDRHTGGAERLTELPGDRGAGSGSAPQTPSARLGGAEVPNMEPGWGLQGVPSVPNTEPLRVPGS